MCGVLFVLFLWFSSYLYEESWKKVERIIGREKKQIIEGYQEKVRCIVPGRETEGLTEALLFITHSECYGGKMDREHNQCD